jgi:hypothetical protein
MPQNPVLHTSTAYDSPHLPHLPISCPICNSFIRLRKSQPILFSTIPQPTQHCSCFHTLPVQSLKYSLTLFVKKVLQAARPHSPLFLQSALPFIAGGKSGGLFLTHQTRSSNRTRFCDTSVPNFHPSHPHKQLRPIGTILKTDSNILVRHT